jgi:hypothetical protein
VAKAVFAGKKIKEFSLKYSFAVFAPIYAILSRFSKYFFMGDRPGDACNRYCQLKKPNDLNTYTHCFTVFEEIYLRQIINS